MKIGLVEVFVDDQERACAFYTEVLGLQVKDDAPYDEGARWLTVVSPEDLDGTELLLAPISNEAAALQAARREIRKPALTLRTTDCRQTHRELLTKGAVFLHEPQETPYGIHAVFEDGCGNLLNLHQEASSSCTAPGRPPRTSTSWLRPWPTPSACTQ
jgi:predicted enzyme related to lactoylglutathione lyase